MPIHASRVVFIALNGHPGCMYKDRSVPIHVSRVVLKLRMVVVTHGCDGPPLPIQNNAFPVAGGVHGLSMHPCWNYQTNMCCIRKYVVEDPSHLSTKYVCFFNFWFASSSSQDSANMRPARPKIPSKVQKTNPEIIKNSRGRCWSAILGSFWMRMLAGNCSANLRPHDHHLPIWVLDHLLGAQCSQDIAKLRRT